MFSPINITRKANGTLTDLCGRLVSGRHLEDVVKARCRHLLNSRHNVTVGIQCHLNAGVPQPFLHDLRMYSLFQHQ